jgi:hypothetical protein
VAATRLPPNRTRRQQWLGIPVSIAKADGAVTLDFLAQETQRFVDLCEGLGANDPQVGEQLSLMQPLTGRAAPNVTADSVATRTDRHL